MGTDLVVLAAVVSSGLVAIAVLYVRKNQALRGVLATVAIVSTMALVAVATDFHHPILFRDTAPPTDRPIQVLEGGYVSSDACRSCHPDQYASWHASYHRTMTQVASPESVVASFAGELRLDGSTYRLDRRGDEFLVEVPPGGRGIPGEHPVVLATGSHHYQVYWYPSGETRKLTLFPFSYRIDEGRWMPIDAVFLFPPNIPQGTDGGRWNQMCSKCHATQARRRVLAEDRMETVVAEFGIACEACHGPGGEHVRANQLPTRRYAHQRGEPDPSIVDPLELAPEVVSHVCGQCHSATQPKDRSIELEWMLYGSPYRPGHDLAATRDPTRKTRYQRWSDGMVRVSSIEYSAMIDSPCYQHSDASRLMTCLSCHVMHKSADDPRSFKDWSDDQLKPEMDGDAACLGCHPRFAEPDALVTHTHHDRGSPGSLCYNCHMPHTSLGLSKAIRSHQVSNPSVAASLETGRPNACNLCHLDRTLGWTSEHLAAWYGITSPELDDDQRSVAASVLWLLGGDAGQREILAWAYRWPPAVHASRSSWMAPFLAKLLEDPYAVVRFNAGRSLRAIPGFETLEYDFVGDPADRARAAARAVEIWTERRRGDGRSGLASVLIDPATGSLDRYAFARLLGKRDDRPVELAE